MGAWMVRGILTIILIVAFSIAIFFCGRSSQNDGFLLKEDFVLTFDDGPDPNNTVKIAQICKRENVPAIFFFIGSQAQKHPEIVKAVSDMGFEIGTHGMEHVRHDIRGYGFNYNSLNGSKKILENIIQKPVRKFRPPFGLRFIPTMRAETATGLQHIGWSSCSDDWKPLPKEEKIKYVLSSLNKGGIVLLHDVQNETADFLPDLISACKQRLSS